MFKKCCGCKAAAEKKASGEAEREKEREAEVYAKADGGSSVPVIVPAPAPTPPPPPAAPAETRARRKSSTTGIKSILKEPEPAAEESDDAGEGAGEGGGAAAAAAALRALASGMLATPHPGKRSGSVPGLGVLPRWLSQEDDDEDDEVFREGGGAAEPPATPVGRDELALRRHRFFSDLLHAHQAAAEHRVRFDPLGPVVAGPGAPASDSASGLEHEQRTPTFELESLLNRLERVTTRLERTVSATEIALLKQVGLQPTFELVVSEENPTVSQTLPNIETQSPDVAKSPEKVPIVLQDPPKSSLAKQIDNLTNSSAKMSVTAFQDIVNGPLASFLSASSQIGGDVAAIAQHVKQAFQAQLQYLTLVAQSSSPSMDQNMALLEPTSTQIRAIQEFREKHRGSQLFNHLSAVSESIAALGWVTVSPAPAPYVKEMNDAGQFYTNRVLKEWKEKDKTHKTWVDSWVETLTELQKFVKQHHTTGLVWGGKGPCAIPSAGAAGIPPPPPPGLPPPPPEMPLGDVAPGSDAQDRSALFAEINRGEAITSSLKKVTPDMQTHKNPTLRSGPAPFKAPAHTNTYRSVIAPGQAVEKPPTFTKEGKKWLIEYQKGNHSLLVDQTEMNNVIYMFKCTDSTLTVKGKVNSVVLDSCRKSSVVFDSVVSSVEFVNCQSVQMQVLNKVPTISIDKTDGCQMYLNSESLDVEIVSAKSSEMNVMVPKSNGDYVEYPVPEQFKTTISSKGLLTVAVESKG